MFDGIRKAFAANSRMWNFAGYWANVVVEYRHLTGLNLDKLTNASGDRGLLDTFCRRAMEEGLPPRDCAIAILQKGVGQSNEAGEHPLPAKKPVNGSRFHDRNADLAIVFDELSNEVSRHYQLDSPEWSALIERDFAANQNWALTPEEVLSIVGEHYAGHLNGLDPNADRSLGIAAALDSVLLVVFGVSPGYAGSISADANVVALSMLSNILEKLRNLAGEQPSAAVSGSIWTIKEFMARTGAAFEPTAQEVDDVQKIQRELSAEFARSGLDFMALHPTIHQALLNEALAFGRVERTVEMFFEVAETIGRKALNEETKAKMLLDFWRDRGRMFGGE